MTNIEHFIKKIIELEILTIPISVSAKPLSEIYLINLDEFSEYFAALNHPEYRMLTTPASVTALNNWQSAYGKIIYGKTKTEKQILEAKEKAFSNLSQICDRDFTIENLIKHKDNVYATSILGLIFYFGLGREKNQMLGMEYLNSAAQNNNLDALIWQLWKYTDNSEQIICNMATLPEFMANPELLEVWKIHYSINKKIKIDTFVINKIGF